MNQFYVSIIFLGITLIGISLVLIMYDRKKCYDDEKRLDEKKNELIKIISDADLMVEELNKFSDYIVTQMDEKNEEVNAKLKIAEERIAEINEFVLDVESASVKVVAKAVNYDNPVKVRLPEYRLKSEASHFPHAPEREVVPQQEASPVQTVKPNVRMHEKVIPINSRHREVLQLAEKGFSDTEIAKKLSMGKGEVHLILGMNR